MTVDLDQARAIIRAELDLYHAQHGRPRPVTSYDLWSSYEAVRTVMAAGRRDTQP